MTVQKPPAAGWSERGISVLNGAFGDYLDRRGNGLAIPMSFVQDGQPLALNAHALRVAQPSATGKVVVLVHGWCCNEDVWRFPAGGATYATRLQNDAGYTPFAVRYNTGMPVAESGADFARHLRVLVDAYPVELTDMVLIGHSMGGLVIRSACAQDSANDAKWLSRVRHIFYLGTPHDGADLERFAQGATVALASTRNPVTRLVGRLLGARSAGVKDLREGLVEPAAVNNALTRMPWLATARHHRLVGTLTNDPRHPVSQALGDGLVRVPPPTPDAGPGATTPEVTIFAGVHHMQLARDPAVYTAILAAVSAA